MGSPDRAREYLVLHFDAPLMSFGAACVDELNETARFPYRSLLAGLIGNALGYDHRDAALLQRLQERVTTGARADRPGSLLVDYHTVDLGQSHLSRAGWTTRGRVQERGKGRTNTRTHIRHRHYLADAFYRVVVGLKPADEPPTLDDVERALRRPARPLFIGRKTCLPAARIVVARVQADDVRAALVGLDPVPSERLPQTTGASDMWWSATETGTEGAGGSAREELIAAFQDRDWTNQIHTGRSFVRRGVIPATPNEES